MAHCEIKSFFLKKIEFIPKKEQYNDKKFPADDNSSGIEDSMLSSKIFTLEVPFTE